MNPIGFSQRRTFESKNQHMEQVIIQRPLNRILAFTRRTIDDVVNNPIAKNEVLGYYKLQNWVRRRGEAVDMDRWWNAG
jgi:hypothetical protein